MLSLQLLTGNNFWLLLENHLALLLSPLSTGEAFRGEEERRKRRSRERRAIHLSSVQGLLMINYLFPFKEYETPQKKKKIHTDLESG